MDGRAAEAFDADVMTVYKIRQQLVNEGFEAALNRKRQDPPPRRWVFDEEKERTLLALAQGKLPRGRGHWTLQLLADELVRLEVVDAVSDETVRKTLKKLPLEPHRQVAWVIPPDHDGGYVARMEDVLDVYQRPYNATAPVVCMDEMPVQLTKETRQPIPARPGRPRRIDYEYERSGTANIFTFIEPLVGWRQTRVTERRTRVDWARALRDLIDHKYSEAETVVLIMDNLNTHAVGSLYEAFEPAEARRLAKRLEIHYTPKHGSWLNIAENELSALSWQCLSRRIGTIEQLQSEVIAWEAPRNQEQIRVHWRFTIDQARIKLRKVYPQIQN